MKRDLGAPGLGELLLSLVFPARCLSCGRVIHPEDFFCEDCREKLPREPLLRLLPLENGRVLPVACPMVYQGGFRKTLHEFKFQGLRGEAGPLGRLLALQAGRLSWQAQGVAYVPLSHQGRKARGYDQSRLLAKSAARALGLPLWDVLEKVRETKTQHTLSREERLINVAGAYGATRKLQGETLLLIDDIVTTGATLSQCALALYQAGAGEVLGLCAGDATLTREKGERTG